MSMEKYIWKMKYIIRQSVISIICLTLLSYNLYSQENPPLFPSETIHGGKLNIAVAEFEGRNVSEMDAS